jgi:predicted enzyme related to lactoylglutathione lyase
LHRIDNNDRFFMTKNRHDMGRSSVVVRCENPAIARTPPEHQRYGHTGVHELGLLVNDIDGWFARIREAGYATQTEYVWPCGDFGRSFLFYDADGNMIQLWEHTANTTFRGANT